MLIELVLTSKEEQSLDKLKKIIEHEGFEVINGNFIFKQLLQDQ